MALPDNALKKKVMRYESFVNDILKEQLRTTHYTIDKLQGDLFEYIQLKNYIETIRNCKLDEESMKTQVDVGCNIFIQANIEDPNKILMDVGLGYYVELSLNEALIFINKKIDCLNNEISYFRKKSAVTKSNIKMVLLGLMEIQNLN